jgi:23S rRNA pseudouridine1911/1915/1917 synthase
MKLAKAMENKSFKKEYIAVVHGALKNANEVIDKPIGKSEDGIKRIIDEKGKRSITEYSVVSKNEIASLVKLNLLTGRTHQIRLHMSSIGHPLYGDVLYGIEELELIPRQALHAYYVNFPHPLENRIVEIKCDLPQDMNNLIEKIELKKVP